MKLDWHEPSCVLIGKNNNVGFVVSSLMWIVLMHNQNCASTMASACAMQILSMALWSWDATVFNCCSENWKFELVSLQWKPFLKHVINWWHSIINGWHKTNSQWNQAGTFSELSTSVLWSWQKCCSGHRNKEKKPALWPFILCHQLIMLHHQLMTFLKMVKSGGKNSNFKFEQQQLKTVVS